MAWSLNKDSTITTIYAPKMCFEIGSGLDGAGGNIRTCLAGSKSQQWQLKGGVGKQQIESLSPGAGCIARPPQQQQQQQQQPSSSMHGFTGKTIGDSPQLVFDVSSLGAGWEKGANVRDLWAHKDLGIMTKVMHELFFCEILLMPSCNRRSLWDWVGLVTPECSSSPSHSPHACLAGELLPLNV
jgi:hypothetical protein